MLCFRKRAWLHALALTLAICLFAGLLFYHQAYEVTWPPSIYPSDIPLNIIITDRIEEGRLKRPHMGLDYSVIAIKYLLKLSTADAMIAALVAFTGLKILILYAWLYAALRDCRSLYFITAMAAILMLVTPLMIPAFHPFFIKGQGHAPCLA